MVIYDLLEIFIDIEQIPFNKIVIKPVQLRTAAAGIQTRDLET